jgi:nicotinamide mononucleotide transporter
MLDVVARLWSVEAVAVALAVTYLILAAQENLWCWACAFISSALYTWVFWSVNLYMEAALNVFYVVMAVVGWWQWRAGTQDTGFGIRTLSLPQHGMLVAAMFILAGLNGWLMGRFTDAAWPFVDSFTTWSSIITTFLVVRKVLYLDRGLYLTVLLFAIYLVIVVFGYLNWRRDWQQQARAGT